MGLLDALAKRGSVASANWANDVPLPNGGIRRMPWNSGFQGLHGMTDRELMKLYQQYATRLQEDAKRAAPNLAAARGSN